MKIFTTMVGLFLLPLVGGVSYWLFSSFYHASLPENPVMQQYVFWFIGGAAVWIVLHIALPAPVLSYVFAHEVSHALLGWAFGAKVNRIRVSRKGGSVELSDTNFIITLAPYFFPFYTLVCLCIYGGLWLFWDISPYRPFFFGLFGLTFSYHLCFTCWALWQDQPDIDVNGPVFSYTFIVLANLVWISFGLYVLGDEATRRYMLAHVHQSFFLYERLIPVLKNGFSMQ